MAYGDMKHRKWFKGKPGVWREIAAKVSVMRRGDTGEAKVKPYRAIACVGTGDRGRMGRTGSQNKKTMHYPRQPGTRCGEANGKTPTLAIRGAFKDLGRNFK